MAVEPDPYAEQARGWAHLHEALADDELSGNGLMAEPLIDAQSSIPDLMAQLRAHTDDVLARLASSRASLAGVDPVATGEPTALVPLALLERVALTISEARLALARSRGRPSANGATPGQRDTGDLERARMVALNMALNGAPQAETELYLQRNFPLGEPARIAAEAYERMRQTLTG